MSLGATDFPAYFRAVHGHDPFPWQMRLADQVLDTGDSGGWPDVLAVPTGCGKTSAIDVALFALAAQPERFPRRIVMVIDRRVVVDQGALHAKRIEKALIAPTDPVALQVAKRLRALWNGPENESPIESTVLRGGMPRDDAWAERPDRPVLALSTVDQIGSRLLFRGYGVSPRMASVHAGLLGHDTLFLLDEVHLSVPFAETLLALRERWRKFWPNPLPDRWDVVRLSATPGLSLPGDRPPFELPVGGEDDEHLQLKPRLQARKPAALREVTVKGRDEAAKRESFVAAGAEAGLELLQRVDLVSGKLRTLGIIVNRVAAARDIAYRLATVSGDRFDVQLLTGRMRPLDRDAVLKTLQPRIKAGRQRDSQSRALIVVATQCIETGADFDFDALITECASLDALKQRFGRLDRLGQRHAEGLASPALILGRSDQVAAKADPDPIYGHALRSTWEWLHSLGEHCDFGIRHLPFIAEEKLSELIAPRVHAPTLLPAHLDAWNQTHPQPEPDPDVALWLHGPQRGEAEVQIVWRADLDELTLKQARQDATRAEEPLDRVAACPPTGGEALSLPLSAVRRWLQQGGSTELADAPGTVEEIDESATSKSSRLTLHWRGEDSQILLASELRPGMTLVVPASYGGLSAYNWNPDAIAPVPDLAEIAQWQRYRRAVLRPCAGTLPEFLPRLPKPEADNDATAAEWRIAVEAWQATMPKPENLPEPWRDIVAALGQAPRIVVHADETITLIGRKARREVVSSEDDGASLTGQETTLARHSQDVWRLADAFAQRLGLPEALRKDLVLAAWLHDAGKADPRFQKWLAGGSAVRLALRDEPLAKSAQTLRDRSAMERARLQSGYPNGYRHELLSVAMVAANPGLLADAHDAELVLHLIGTHHGWCRPFASFQDDAENLPVILTLLGGPEGREAQLQAGTRHGLARLDSGVTDRFWNLTERYGWWGLAWLEAILRLADHRASAGLKGEHDE